MTNEKLKKALRVSATEEFNNINRETVIWEPSPQFRSEMEKLMASAHKRHGISFKRVLLAAAVILLIASFSVLSSADVRNRVIRFFTENRSDHVDINYGFDTPGDITLRADIESASAPDFSGYGFTLVSTDSIADAENTVWENDRGEMIIFQKGNGLTLRGVDNETLEKSVTVKNGTEITVYTEKEYILLLWNTEQYTFSVDYYGNRSKDELIEFLSLANLF